MITPQFYLIPLFFVSIVNSLTIKPYFLDPGADLSTLVQVITLHRHGDRNRDTDTSFLNDPNKQIKIGPKERGQLTAIGKGQGYELGRYLRARYDGFLSRTYSISEFVAHSSDVDRTIQTCAALLAGLYPPDESDPESMWNAQLKWQPIPIHTKPTNMDKVLLQYQACPKYTALKKKQENSNRSIEFNLKHRDFYDFLQKHSGEKIHNSHAAHKIIDTLIIERAHGLVLPSWTNEADFWIKASNVQVQSLIENEGTGLQEELRVGPFLTSLFSHIDQRLGEISSGKGKALYASPKFVEFSAHDSTVYSVMRGLGIDNNKMPPYAAALLFEVHINEDTPSGSAPFLKIFYRNETESPAYEMKVPDCGEPCLFSKLKEMKRSFVLDDTTWLTKCNTNIDD